MDPSERQLPTPRTPCAIIRDVAHRPRSRRGALSLVIALTGMTACSSGHTPSAASHRGVDSAEDYCTGTTYGSQVVLYSTKNLEYWYTDVLTSFQANCGV